MNDFLKDWLTGSPELWQIVVGLIMLIALILQRLANIREVWFNYRKGLSNLILEKHQLEVIKLKYEIEAIKKTHGFIDDTPSETPETLPEETIKAVPKKPSKIVILPSHTWSWLLKHPVFGEFILHTSKAIVGFYFFAFGIGIVFMPFMGLIDPEFNKNPWIIAVMWLFYILLTYACYKGYRRLKDLVIELRLASQKAPPLT